MGTCVSSSSALSMYDPQKPRKLFKFRKFSKATHGVPVSVLVRAEEKNDTDEIYRKTSQNRIEILVAAIELDPNSSNGDNEADHSLLCSPVRWSFGKRKTISNKNFNALQVGLYNDQVTSKGRKSLNIKGSDVETGPHEEASGIVNERVPGRLSFNDEPVNGKWKAKLELMRSYYDFEDIDLSFFVDKQVSDDENGWSSDENSDAGQMPILPTESISDESAWLAREPAVSHVRNTSTPVTEDVVASLARCRNASDAVVEEAIAVVVGENYQHASSPSGVRGRLGASLQHMRSLRNGHAGGGLGAVAALSERQKDIKAIRRHTTGITGVPLSRGWSNRRHREFLRETLGEEKEGNENEENMNAKIPEENEEEGKRKRDLKRTRNGRGIRPTSRQEKQHENEKVRGLEEILADVRAEEQERNHVQRRREHLEERGVQSSLFGGRLPQGMTRGRFVTFSGDMDALDRLGMDFFEGKTPDGF